MLSALRKLGGSGRPAEVESLIVADLGISPQEQNAITKSGQSRFINQLHWVKFYLMKAGFISSSERGVWSLTEKGNRAELTHSAALDVFKSVQEQFPKNAGEEKNEPIADEPKTVGVEDLGASVENYRQSLLTILKQLPPAGFEKICQRLLRESGFQ